MKLNSPVSNIPLIGPAYAQKLANLNIQTVSSLLHHYPARYWDLSKVVAIADLHPEETVTVSGRVVSGRNLYLRSRRSRQNVVIEDDSGRIAVTWFNQPFLIKTLVPGTKVNLAGKVSLYQKQLTLTSPQFELVKSAGGIHTGRLVPIYPETAGLSSKWLRSRLAYLLKNMQKEISNDWLTIVTKKKYQLMDLDQALNQIHFPENESQLKKAIERLSFDELVLLKLRALQRRRHFDQLKLNHQLNIDQEKVLQFISSLPFTLTAGQDQGLKEILNDLSDERPMNRLLQGDVGSGKTVVAAVAIYVAFLNGLQSILLAPTEILAQQHFDTLNVVFKNKGLKLKLVTGSTSPKEKDKADVYVGTHALLHRQLSLDSLGLLVVDEQQRFGVKQRSQLLSQGQSTPHLLSMTATPIPRTVALTVYADLDLSIIDELPPGRQPVKTWVVSNQKRLAAYRWLEKQITTNKSQAFVVCPLIDQSSSETLKDIKSVKQEFATLQEVFPRLKLGLLHGRLKSDQKIKVLNQFRQGDYHLLVTTPVIEVGIDIPAAAIMMIEDGERFGLAQLHQLRGRVGRNNQQGFCLIFSRQTDSTTLTRLKHLENVDSGLKLAEIDLKLRGPGSLWGTAQHGYFKLQLADLTDQKLLKTADQVARELNDNLTPALNNQLKAVKMDFVNNLN